MRYQNVSAGSWRRPSGEEVPPGAVFDATDREHARIQRRGHLQARVRLVDPAAGAAGSSSVPAIPAYAVSLPALADGGGVHTDPAPTDELPEAVEGVGDLVHAESPAVPPAPPREAWTLRMTPDVYLKLHPTGSHAAAAQAWVEATR